LLEELRGKLDMLHINKRDYEKFEKENKIIYSIKSLLYERKIEKFEDKFFAAEQQEEGHRLEVIQLEAEREGLEEDIEKLTQQIESAERRLEGVTNMISGEDEMVEDLFDETTRKGELFVEKRQKQIVVERELANVEVEISEIEERRVAAERALIELQNKKGLLSSKAEFENIIQKGDSSDVLRPKIGVMKSMTEALKQKVARLRNEVEELEAAIGEGRNESETLESQKKSFENKFNDLISQKKSSQSQITAAISKLKDLHSKIKINEEQYVSHLDTFVKKAKMITGKKFNIDMIHLMAVINTFRKRHPGQFACFLIDFMNFRDKLAVAIEALYLPKLFSVVVENEEMAQEVVAINKELQGGRITVFPITTGFVPGRADQSMIHNTSASMINENDMESMQCVLLKNFIEFDAKGADALERCVTTLEKIVDFQSTEVTKVSENYLQSLFSVKGDLATSALSNFISSSVKMSGRTHRPRSQIIAEPSQAPSQLSNTVLLTRHRPQAEDLIQNIFKKGALVANLDLATQISNEQKLNCATPEGEVVFAGGYMARLGGFESMRGALNIYVDIQNALFAMDSVQKDLEKFYAMKAEIDVVISMGEKDTRHIDSGIKETETAIKILSERMSAIKQANFVRTQDLFNIKNELMKKTSSIEGNEENIQMLDSMLTGKGSEKMKKKLGTDNLVKISAQIEKQMAILSTLQKELNSKKSEYNEKFKLLDRLANFEGVDVTSMEMSRGFQMSRQPKPTRDQKKDKKGNPELKAIEDDIKKLEKRRSKIQNDLDSVRHRLENARNQHAIVSAHKENFQKLIRETNLKMVK
jgi:chromosome segregation ATPase